MFNFSLRSSILPLWSMSILVAIGLNSVSGILAASISFNYFTWNFSYIFIWGIFLYLHILCLCISTSAMTHRFVLMTLWCSSFFLITWAQCSWHISQVLCASCCYRWVLNTFDLFGGWSLLFMLNHYKEKPWPTGMSYCVAFAFQGWDVPSRAWYLPEFPFECVAYVVTQVELCCGLKSTMCCFGSGSTWQSSGTGRCQMRYITRLGIHFWGYHHYSLFVTVY